MNFQAIIAVLFVVVAVFYVGLVPLPWADDAADTETSVSTPSAENTQQTSPGKQEELTTQLSPARDLAGRWQGTARWTNNVANPGCAYEGVLLIVFRQEGNRLAGEYTTTITKSTQLLKSVPCSPEGTQGTYPLTGLVSSSAVQFDVTNIHYTGTFTSDLLQGTLESCLNQECNDGTRAVGFKGNFSLRRA